MKYYEISLTPCEIEQLSALEKAGLTFAGDTISHSLVRALVEKGLACRQEGYYAITFDGAQWMDCLRDKLPRIPLKRP